jgi:hypothetical protein
VKVKLQVNTSGAWKNVVEFQPERRAEVIEALQVLRDVLREDDPKWSILHDSGKREWLK